MDADKLLYIKLAEKGEHVSVGHINDVDGVIICNLLRLGAKSVIYFMELYADYDDNLFAKSLAEKIKIHTYTHEQIIFSSKKVSDIEIRIIAEKAKK